MGKKITIGSSPEMLLRVTNDQVETFPIAGTRKISTDEAKNEQLRQELINDEKELAEHTMLVDLGRNDIGKVCNYGTVHVNKLMEVKKFILKKFSIVLNKLILLFNAFKTNIRAKPKPPTKPKISSSRFRRCGFIAPSFTALSLL